MTMDVPLFAIGAGFRLKGGLDRTDRHAHGAHQLGQHMIGFDFQMIRLQLNRNVPIAQMIGGPHEVQATGGADAQHRLRRRQDPNQRTVFSHQHIATTHDATTG